MNGIAFTIIVVISFALFFHFLNIRLTIIRSLQPEVRWDRWWERLRNVVQKGFLQQRMIQGDRKPGIMHTIIFWGFMALLFRKLQLFTIAYYDDPQAGKFFVYPGLIGGLYATLKDLIELAVMGAIGYAFYRRFVLKPKRFEPNREAIVVLSLIMTIMVTDFFYDGFKFALYGHHPALHHEASFAFVGNLLGHIFSIVPFAWQQLFFHFFYWVQILTVFTFLVLIPMGEHFHILTALPALFFAHKSPLNKVPKVDLEALMGDDAGDTEPKVGIHNAKDLLWKDGLDVFTCTECGRCKDACPTFLTDKPLSLKWVNDSLKHHLTDVRAQLASAEPVELPPLVGDIISEDTLWACTTCGYCEQACPIELEHLSKFYKMRQHRVMMEGAVPAELQNAFENYERSSNPWGLNSDTRGAWADGLDVPLVEDADQVAGLDYLFYVGSAQSYDARNQKVAKAFVKILEAAGVKYAILGAAEGSTGECVRRAGNEMLFQTLAGTLVETLNTYDVKNIVTCDPHAYNSLKNEYPDFGGNYNVIHHTQLIDSLLAEGRIKISADLERVIYHEPCYLGRHNKEYEAPRRIIARLSKDQPLEFAMSREKSMCCGAGGGRMWMEETIGSRINVERVNQALTQAPKVIATACPYCTIMITDGVAHHNKEEEIQTKDIAELVADALVMTV